MTALFYGGPLDGTLLEMNETPPRFYFILRDNGNHLMQIGEPAEEYEDKEDHYRWTGERYEYWSPVPA